MKFQAYLPCDRLKPFIKRFVISEASEGQTYKILPDTSLVMGFQYRGHLSYLNKSSEMPLAASGITGLHHSFRIFKNSPATGSVLVVFTETGAASFFKEPIHELFGESIALNTFVKPSFLAVVEEQLSATTHDLERIRLIERFLLSQVQESSVDPLVTLAVQYIFQSGGTLRITALMDRLCISQSPLEKRFRQVVGTSPKKFASIVRMHRAIKLLSEGQRFTDTGLTAGYFDQAHFGKEFKLFTGVTPTEFTQALGT